MRASLNEAKRITSSAKTRDKIVRLLNPITFPHWGSLNILFIKMINRILSKHPASGCVSGCQETFWSIPSTTWLYVGWLVQCRQRTFPIQVDLPQLLQSQPKVSLHGLKVLPHPSFSFSHYYSCTAIGLPVPASCQQRPTSQTSSIILSWHIPLPPVSIIWFTPMTSTNYLKAKETCGHLLLVDAFTLNVPILPQNAAPGAALVAADCFTGWMG